MPHERRLPVFPLNVPIYTVWQDVMDGAGGPIWYHSVPSLTYIAVNDDWCTCVWLYMHRPHQHVIYCGDVHNSVSNGPITRLGSLKSHPAATPTSGIAVGSNGPVKGRWLARGSVLQFPWGKNSAVGTPADPLALESGTPWSVPWDLRTWKIFPSILSLGPLVSKLPGESDLGADGTSGHTFPDLFPPLADSHSCYILSEDLDPSRKNGRSHTSFASYWREGRGSPPSTFLREIETYIVNVTTTTLEKTYMEKESIKYLHVILPCGT